MKFKFTYLFAALLLLLTSCKESNTEVHNVAAEFDPYIQKFFADAERYGYAIPDKNIVMKFAKLDGNKAGVTYMNRVPVYIEIDEESWHNMVGPNEDNERENLIFHEMGHGFLRRLHKNDVLQNGDWQTMMCGDELPNGRGSNINYRGIRKEYYIKELFTETTEVPSWSTYKPDFSTIQEHTHINVTPADAKYWYVGKEDEKYETKIEDNTYICTTLTETGMFIPLLNGVKGNSIYDVTKDFYYEARLKVTSERQADPSFGIAFANIEDGYINPLHYLMCTTKKKFVNVGENSCRAPFIQLYNEKINGEDYNTIAIRKQKDTLYYYLNGEFIYHNDLTGIPVKGSNFGFTVSGYSTASVTNAKINIPDGTKSAPALPSEAEEIKPFDFNIDATKNSLVY